MKYDFKAWHLAIVLIALLFLYQAKIIPNFLGATLVSGDGYQLYGEYTLSDYVFPLANSTDCTTGYTYNSVREMCELSNSYLATWANEFGFTNMTCGAEVCDANSNCVIQCTSKYWDITQTKRAGGSASYSGGDPAFSLATGAGGDCGNGNYGTITATSKQGFVGKNFKMDVDLSATKTYYGGPAQAGVSIGGVGLASVSATTSGASNSGLVQTEENALDPDIYTLYYQGQKVADIDTSTGNEMKVVITSQSSCGSGGSSTASITVTKPRSQALFGCELGPNELLGYETFAGPQDISLFSTRYAVIRFCLQHPAVIFDEASGGSTNDASIYERLRNGEAYSIPDGKVIGLFYVFKNDGSISVTCPAESYDVENNRCFVPGGLATFCSEGTFDPAQGTCVVTPDTQLICPEGGYYDTAQDACIYHPPIQYICAYGSYSALTGVCEYVPPVNAVCPAGTTWNEVSGFCESFPSSQIICPPFYAYDATSDKCTRAPQTDIICPTDSTFNTATDKCERTPGTDNVCPTNFVYNSVSDKCEYTPSSTIICSGGGVYNSATDACEIEPPTEPVCSKGVLSEDMSKCIYEPDTENQCTSGGLYDAALDKCVIVPDYDYLCIGGEIITQSDGALLCQIELTGFTVCPEGFNWDGERCIQEGGIVTPLCDVDADCVHECAVDQSVLSGTCSSGTCSIDTALCPTEEPAKTFWETAKDWMQWIIDNILYILIFLIALNIFLIIVQRGHVTGKQLEMYGRRNKEGVLFGLVGGAIFALLMSVPIVSWAMILVILSGGLLGTIIDHLYRPRR
jgi:hypothetical protein